MRGLLRHAAQKIFEGHQAGGAAEDVVANLRLDVDHELFEDLKSLRFIFDQRVALAVSAQADAVTQTVHFVEMLLPQFVDRAQDDVALDFLQSVGILETDL